MKKGNQRKKKGRGSEREKEKVNNESRENRYISYHKAVQVMAGEWRNVSFRPQSKHTQTDGQFQKATRSAGEGQTADLLLLY